MDLAIVGLIVGGLCGFFVWAVILLKWRIGVWAMLGYAMINGLVVVAMYPMGLSSLGLVSRDLLIVAPLYISLFIFGGRQPYNRVPWHVVAVCVVFAFIVVGGMANPGVPNLLVALIGAKVWLFYMPLMFVGVAFLRTERQLVMVLRFVVALAWIPWVLGGIQYLGALTIGFDTIMTSMFGSYGVIASGNFTCYDFGAPFCRLPGSFTFNSQYGVFCLFMMFPIFMLLSVETQRSWRNFTQVSFAVGFVAGMLSGARGNLILLPAAVFLIQFLRFRLRGGIPLMAGFAVIGVVLFSLIGINAKEAYTEVGDLGASYSEEYVVGGFVEGLIRGGLLGVGTGTNTGPARHAYDSTIEMQADQNYAIENFLAKTLAELGILGFVVLMSMFGLMAMHLLQGQLSCRQQRLKDCAATVTAFVIFTVATAVKGWALDIDPLNFYFYLFVGFGFAIPYIDRESASVSPPASMIDNPPAANDGRYRRARPAVPQYGGRNPYR